MGFIVSQANGNRGIASTFFNFREIKKSKIFVPVEVVNYEEGTASQRSNARGVTSSLDTDVKKRFVRMWKNA